ncbi:MAG: hypothetical protein MJH10_09320 [Epibacterium sp.]|nr:hypothetical protein [Epibacterium sp.]NQX73735.1 hypothetical protein [Epibacterium sp.]
MIMTRPIQIAQPAGPLPDAMLSLAAFNFQNQLYSDDGEVSAAVSASPLSNNFNQAHMVKDDVTGRVVVSHNRDSNSNQFWYSDDNGGTWQGGQILFNSQSFPARPYAKVHAFDGICHASFSGALGSIARSDDGGASWALQPIPTFSTIRNYNDFAYSPSLRRWVAVGQDRYFAYSDDQGLTWQSAAAPAIASNRELTCVTWNDIFNTFIAVEVNQNAWTSPDGITWTQRTIPAATLIGNFTYEIAVNWNTGVTCVSTEANFGNRSPIIVSVDGGQNWTTTGFGYVDGIGYKLVYNGDRFYVQSGGPTFTNATDAAQSVDGTNWTAVATPHPPQQISVASLRCAPVGGNFITYGSEANPLEFRNRLGQIVSTAPSPWTGAPSSVFPSHGIKLSASEYLLLGYGSVGGGLFELVSTRSTDGGQTWNVSQYPALPTVNGAVTVSNEIDQSPNEIIRVWDAGGVLRSTDGGVSWAVVPTPLTVRGKAIAYSPTLNRWVVSGTNGTTGTAYSDDGGLTWTLTTDQIFATDLIWNGATQEFIGTRGTQLVRSSDGDAWTFIPLAPAFGIGGNQQNGPFIAVTNDSIAFAGQAQGSQGTREFAYSSDNGATWTNPNNAPINTSPGHLLQTIQGLFYTEFGSPLRTSAVGNGWSNVDGVVMNYNARLLEI